jgi:hypothetical protein
MELQFESYQEGFGGELQCPACGFNYLHHEKVEIFERNEDEEKGLHVTVENGVVTTDMNLSGNPSARRHGLTIQFWCEGCEAKPVLSISQHKGNTWVDLN